MLDIVYTSRKTNNTHDFVHKLIAAGYPADRVQRLTGPGFVPPEKYVLFTASYCGDDLENVFHPDLEAWIQSDPNWYKNCVCSVISGNHNFGKNFAISGKILYQRYKIKKLHDYELKGLPCDVVKVMAKLKKMAEWLA